MERLNLYPHNNDSSKRIIDAFNNGENVVGIVHATGTGKTFNALSLCLENKDKKIVYLVPSKAVSEHIKKVIESNPNLSLERDFPNLEFRTYQSLCNLSTKELEDINADYLILDEFHHIGAPIWGDRVNTIIETHPNIKVFGMTAYTVRDRGTAYERDMANPEGKELFSNKIVSTYDLPDAMIDGVLPLPIYRSAYTQLQGMAQELEERVLNGNVSKEEKEKYLELLDAVKRRIAEAPSIKDVIIRNLKKDGKYIYFCPPGATEGVNDIETIKKEVLGWLKDFVNEEDIVFYQTTSELGEIGIENRECFYNDTDLHGKSTDGKLRIMFAINQYNEGVHAPNIDGVILGRGTSSDIVYFEQIGRALSVRGNTYEEFNKYMEYSIYELRGIAQKRNIDTSKLQTKEEIIEKLIAPVIIDLANNISFIKELENNLKDRIKQVTETKTNQERRIRLIPEVSFDIEVLNEELFDVLVNLQNRLSLRTWEENYKLAEEYYRKNGHLDIPQDYKVTLKDGMIVNLGNWIMNQRQFYKKSKLSEDRIKLLENIGMKWSINLRLEWSETYKLVEEYYRKNGHLDIPPSYKVTLEDGNVVNLGRWVEHQREVYKKGKLSEDRIKLLENIGMKWSINLRLEWSETYKLAEEYYSKNGHLDIPPSYKVTLEDGNVVNLGRWVDTQRQVYKKGKLSEDRIKLLENIGMKWSNLILGWSETYKLVEEYYRKNGHLEIPWDYKAVLEDGTIINLGIWISTQRKLYKKGKLSEDRIKLLENIGMKWSIKLEWSEIYRLAEEYYRKNGHLKIPRDYKAVLENESIVNLGEWISNQRHLYQKGQLSEDKVKLLESIGMKWSLQSLAWEKYFNLAKLYYEQNGNLNVPKDYVIENDNDNINLGIWISNQRKTYKRGQLSNEKKEMLESIGMIWEIRKRKPKEDNKSLCEEYGLDYEKYPDLLKIPFEVFSAKLNYLIDNKIPVINSNNELNPIFFMSDVNMQVMYGISLEELGKQYSNSNKKGGK